jgi:hypothetical protein
MNLHEESTLLDVYHAIPEKHRKKYLKVGYSILDPYVRKCRNCDHLRTVKNVFHCFYNTKQYEFSCHDGTFEVSYSNLFSGSDKVELNPDAYLEDVEEILTMEVANLRKKEPERIE